MGLKNNLNKIHISLLNNFQSVTLEERENKGGNGIHISVNEGNKTVNMFIEKKDLEERVFKWKYMSNPNDLNSRLVERVSDVDNIVGDIVDILEKNRFDSDYLKNI